MQFQRGMKFHLELEKQYIAILGEKILIEAGADALVSPEKAQSALDSVVALAG